jgi:hypothetical protein
MRVIAISQQFAIDNNSCENALLKFRGTNNDYGFDYSENDFQIVRVPANIYNPKYPTNQTQYRTQNGAFRNGVVAIDKQYDFITSNVNEVTHDAIKVALMHRELYIDGKQFFNNGDYEVAEYDQILKISQATTTVVEQRYNKTNNNCN